MPRRAPSTTTCSSGFSRTTRIWIVPPKSTGREHYDERFVDEVVKWGRSADARITTSSPRRRPSRHLYLPGIRTISALRPPDRRPDRGRRRTQEPGHHAKLADSFAPIRVEPIDGYGIESDVKEALCFAVLAHEFLNGVPTALPSVTGASRAAMLGKLCLPA
jgi:anhydro-N-acetylmuramic acid kinase